MTTAAERLSLPGRQLLDRRRFLGHSATALGSIALTQLLGHDGLLAAPGPVIHPARPYAARPPHALAQAKNVVVIFCAALRLAEQRAGRPARQKRQEPHGARQARIT